MKIVHITLTGSFNDDWGYQDNLIPKYNKLNGHDVTIITTTFKSSMKQHEKYVRVQPGQYLLGNGIKVIRIKDNRCGYGHRMKKLKKHIKLYSLLTRENPNLIFMHGIQSLDIIAVAKYIKNNPECKLAVDNHATYENSGRNFLSREVLHKIIYRKAIKIAMPYIDRLFMIAPRSKEFALDMYKLPEKKIEYLFLGADSEKIDFENKSSVRRKIRQDLNIGDDDFVIITGGKIDKNKNMKLLIDALDDIEDSSLKIIIFGVFLDDVYEEKEFLLNDSRFSYVGWLKGDEVYDYYLASDVAVFPGSKSALWEQAICCGLPLICRTWSGMEYVDVGGNCIFINNDKDLLRESIINLMSNKEKLNKMSSIARDKGCKRFSYEKIALQAINFEKYRG